MSSFFEKLKRGMGIEEEGIEVEDFKKPSPPRKKLREVREVKAEEEIIEVPEKKISKEAVKEMKIQEKTEEKKWPEPEGQLAVDVYQTDGELVIQSVIAGIKPEGLDIAAQGDVVTIKGKRERVGEEERNYFYQECYWGPFSREIILPVEADVSRAEATMTEGILTIRIPKIERERKKKIIVK